MELGVMAMKEYSAFPQTPALLDLATRLFSVITRILVAGVSPSAEMKSVYSAAPAKQV